MWRSTIDRMCYRPIGTCRIPTSQKPCSCGYHSEWEYIASCALSDRDCTVHSGMDTCPEPGLRRIQVVGRIKMVMSNMQTVGKNRTALMPIGYTYTVAKIR